MRRLASDKETCLKLMLQGRRRRGINILDASKMGNRFLGKWTINSNFLVLPKRAPHTIFGI
jgi:hypothetical protein